MTILVEELKKDKNLFFHYTRMSLEVYNNLLKKVSPALTKIKKFKEVTNIRTAFINNIKIFVVFISYFIV